MSEDNESTAELLKQSKSQHVLRQLMQSDDVIPYTKVIVAGMSQYSTAPCHVMSLHCHQSHVLRYYYQLV